MGHRLYSHKSAESLPRSPHAIKTARIAIRSSSVRVKSTPRTLSSYTDRLKAQSGHHDIPDARRGIHKNHDISPSYNRSLRGSCKAETPHDNDIAVAKRTAPEANIKAIQPPDPRTVKSRITGPERPPSTTIGNKHDLEGRQATCLEKQVPFNLDEEKMKEQESEDGTENGPASPGLEGNDDRTTFWQQYRRALQQTSEGEEDSLTYSPAHLPAYDSTVRRKSWKNSANNFFPRSLSHLHQEDIVEIVLEEKRRLREQRKEREAELAVYND